MGRVDPRVGSGRVSKCWKFGGSGRVQIWWVGSGPDLSGSGRVQILVGQLGSHLCLIFNE